MMGLLKQMDLSDRNYLTWFQEFSDALDAYNTEIGADQDLYCSKPDYLLSQRLSPMLDKISLVLYEFSIILPSQCEGILPLGNAQWKYISFQQQMSREFVC